MDHLRAENHHKEQIIMKLNSEVDEKERGFGKEKKEQESSFVDEINVFKNTVLSKEARIRELEEHLHEITTFKEMKLTYEKEIETLKLTLEEKTKKYKDKVSKLENKFYEEKVKLQRQIDQRMVEIKKVSQEVTKQRVN
jgi:hypothetical protein